MRKRKVSEPLKLYWWKHPDSQYGNFGDEITPEIIEKLWGIKCKWAPLSECSLIGAGSIVEKAARENQKGHKVDVWGSGFMHSGRRPFINNDFRFFAVRGKLSRKRLLFKKPRLSVGDPGILAGKVYPATGNKVYALGVIAHYADTQSSAVVELAKRVDVKIIDPLQRPAKVAKDITSCKLILSSSLHGLIFADSFGVPNYWTPLSDNVHGGEYKYRDYFSSVDRRIEKIEISRLINDNELIQRLIDSYEPIKDLPEKQAALIKAFPYRKVAGR